MENLSYQKLVDDLREGTIYIRFDLFKESGKWGYGGFCKLNLEEANRRMHHDSKAEFLDYLSRNQSEVIPNTFPDYFVVLSENHYEEISSYKSFFTRMYKPLNS